MPVRKKAWLFDLDGTLLPLDIEEFLPRYLQAVGLRMSEVTEPAEFIRHLMFSTAAMMDNRDPGSTNREVFLADFERRLGKDRVQEWWPLIEAFYRHDFPLLGTAYRPDPAARRAVQAALARGDEVILATNPLFPEVAIYERMRWAGIGDLPFALVTSYENMHACKPHREYYQEILELRSLLPSQCTMVGNDVQEDVVPARSLGLATFLVEGLVIDRNGQRCLADYSGSLVQLAEFIEAQG